jgi:hypothetical protein
MTSTSNPDETLLSVSTEHSVSGKLNSDSQSSEGQESAGIKTG